LPPIFTSASILHSQGPIETLRYLEAGSPLEALDGPPGGGKMKWAALTSRCEISMSMIQLDRALSAWGTPEFESILAREVETLGSEQLPLQQALAISSYALPGGIRAMVTKVTEEKDLISAKVGIFYNGVIAGCSCADDPTPIDENVEFCTVRIDIEKASGRARVALLEDDYPSD